MTSNNESPEQVPGVTRPRQVIIRSEDDLKKFENELNQGSISDLAGVDIWSAVSTWKNKSEVWPIVYGGGICALIAGCAGAYITNRVRTYLYLGQAGRFTSYLGSAGVPTMTLGVCHNFVVTTDILEQETLCPVCVQVKAAAIQLVMGVAYPMFLVPFAIFPIMTRLEKSFKVPKLLEEPRAVFNFAKQLYKPFAHRLPYIAAFQIVAAMGITYLEQEAFYNNVLPEIKLHRLPKIVEPPNRLLR